MILQDAVVGQHLTLVEEYITGGVVSLPAGLEVEVVALPFYDTTSLIVRAVVEDGQGHRFAPPASMTCEPTGNKP